MDKFEERRKLVHVKEQYAVGRKAIHCGVISRIL
jgi:hypothetical protein